MRSVLQVILGFLILGYSLTALSQSKENKYRDTLYVKGANLQHMSRYITYYVDTSSQLSINEIAGLQTRFRKWELGESLNLGLNPYPVWLRLNVTNVADYSIRFWLSFYTHADSVMVFQKIHNQFICTDTLSYNIVQSERKVDARFLVAALRIESKDTRQFFVKILSRTKTQNFVVDFTTPESNLLWERDFLSAVLFFTGCFALVALISLLLAIVSRERMFFYYGAYIITVILLLLSQELILPVLPSSLFYFFNGIHPMSVAILGLCIHFHVILYIFGTLRPEKNITLIFRRVNQWCLYYGLMVMAGYFIFRGFALTHYSLYHYFYYVSIGIILLLLTVTFITIVASGVGIKNRIVHTLVALLLFYFNPAGYYLNYSGIVHYYEITYPNYFYWFLCVEFIALGIVIALKYRKTVQTKEEVMREYDRLEQESYLREFEAKEQKQQQIARDLHDDLGATLGALKLIITNNYHSDTDLVNMISRANTDLRYFFSKLSSSDLRQKGLFKILEEKKQELNRSRKVYFSSIFIGDDKSLSDTLLLDVYRITSELLLNILKHSAASEASVQLIIDEMQIELITEDNGNGYDPNQGDKGMGLGNIHSRTKQLQGQIHVSSSASGTTTIITIPR